MPKPAKARAKKSQVKVRDMKPKKNRKGSASGGSSKRTNQSSSAVRRPQVDDELTLMTDFGKTKAICVEVSDDPAHPGGALLRVMARGSFDEGQQCWIVDRHGSKIGAVVESVTKQTIDGEVLLAAMFG
jgi:hypothetical protein